MRKEPAAAKSHLSTECIQQRVLWTKAGLTLRTTEKLPDAVEAIAAAKENTWEPRELPGDGDGPMSANHGRKISSNWMRQAVCYSEGKPVRIRKGQCGD